jgi:DNA-directed RNA polymerase specialized sigma24 family protein
MLVRSRGGVAAAALDAYPSDLSDLQTLTPTARAVLYLRHVDGWSFEMIAAQLGLPPATARQIATRAHRQLRLQIEET